MIDNLFGKIQQLTPAYMVINVGGVGYFLKISLYTYDKAKELKTDAEVLIHTVLVASVNPEFKIALYGFMDIQEREAFGFLHSVSGIGYMMAQKILSHISPPQLYQYIHNEEVEELVQVKGIGKKAASRIVVDLKDKIPAVEQQDILHTTDTAHKHIQETQIALATLGYKKQEIQKAITKIKAQIQPSDDVEHILKMVLQNM